MKNFKNYNPDYIDEDLYEYYKNFTFDQFKHEQLVADWFYWSMVLIRENVIYLNQEGLISQEIMDRIFGDNSKIFMEKFPNLYPKDHFKK